MPITARKYRKKPVVVEALKFTGDNWAEIEDFVPVGGYNDDGTFQIATLEGEHKCSIGDYVIKGVAGEFYPCNPGIFESTYEAVSTIAFRDAGAMAAYLGSYAPPINPKNMPNVVMGILMHPSFAFGVDVVKAVNAVLVLGIGIGHHTFATKGRLLDYINARFEPEIAKLVLRESAGIIDRHPEKASPDSRVYACPVQDIVGIARGLKDGGLVHVFDGAYAKLKYILEGEGKWKEMK